MTGKTAKKTAKSGRNGNEIPLGAHPGNTGGKPGRSGRRKHSVTELAEQIARDDLLPAMRAILVDKERDDQARIAAARAIIPLVPKEEVVFRIDGPEDATQWAIMLKEALTDLLPRPLLEKVMTSIQARDQAHRAAGGIVPS